MNNKFCLGTVQFGMKYGINNSLNRQPEIKESFSILDCALQNGINYFDTASVYGNSEDVLGQYGKFNHNCNIISKLKSIDEKILDINQYILNECKQSLYRLKKYKLYGYLLHNGKDIYNKKVIEGLQNCKNENLVENIGVSIYDPEDALYAVKNTKIDFIQIPYNVLDQRLNFSSFFDIVKRKKIKVFARSSFLQGLLTMDLENIALKMPKAFKYIKEFEDISKENGYTRKEAAFLFCYFNPNIDYVVFGVDNVEQLKANVKLIEKGNSFKNCYDCLYNRFKDIDKRIISPNLW